MRFGNNPQTGEEWSLTSWRALDDPATGDYRQVLDTKGLPESVMWQGDVKKYRSGPWNGLWFSGIPEIASYSGRFSVEFVVRPDEIAYTFNTTAGEPLSRLVLSEVGVLERRAWDSDKREWAVWMQSPRGICDNYGKCGAFGLCNEDNAATQFCSCIGGFSPVSPSQWSMRATSGGCRRDVPLECGNGTTTDGFRVLKGVKLPDTDNATVDRSATVEQCRVWCLANCSCVAYAPADIRGTGSGCVMWKDDILDVRYLEDGQELYVRLSKSELGEHSSQSSLSK
jgi:hypothetical protein